MACKIAFLLVSLITVVLTEPNKNDIAENKVEQLELTGLDNRKPIFHQKNKNPDGTFFGTYGYYDSYDRYHVLNYLNSTLGLQVVNDYLPFEPLNGLLFSPFPTPTLQPPEDKLPEPVFTPEEEKKTTNGSSESLDTNEHSVIRSTVLPPPPSFDFFQPFQFDTRPQHIDQQGTEPVVSDGQTRNDTDLTGIYTPPYPHFFHGLVRVDNNATAPLPPAPPQQIPFTPFNFQGFPFAQQHPEFPFSYYPARPALDGANDTSGLDSTDGEAKPNDPVELAPLKPDKTDDKEPATTTNRVGPQPQAPPIPSAPQQPGLLNSYFNQYLPYSPFDSGFQQNSPFGSYPTYPYYGGYSSGGR